MEVLSSLRNINWGAIAGDSLGAPYEFDNGSIPTKGRIKPHHSSMWDAYQWTDDTAMAVRIIQHPTDRDALFKSWQVWAKTAKDVGSHTAMVLNGRREPNHDRSAGNGALMRVWGSVAAGHTLIQALDVAHLTHDHPDSDDTVKHMYRLLTLQKEPTEYRADPSKWSNWSAPGALRDALVSQRPTVRETIDAAIRLGGDTDTVASIAGAIAFANPATKNDIPESWHSLFHE